MHPPLLGFYLAGLTALVGWKETAVHAGMLLPAISLVLGIYALASRLSRNPVPATLCACLTPVFLVSATTVMTDVLMLGFWCWATVLWLDGLERRHTPRLAAAAFVMGLCALSKFFGMNLVPLLFAYTLLRERRLGLWAVWLLASLVILFWVPLTLLFGLRGRHAAGQYFAGAIATILTGLTVFFVGGGLSLVRYNRDNVPWFSWIFPNIYAVDPLRDLILVHTWPLDWTPTLLKLVAFAVLSLAVGLGFAARRLRRLD